jgi:hypothetical protein
MPNGFQVFVKDSEYRGEYGTWHNITEEEWFPVTLTVSATKPRGGWIARDFDPTQIIMIGLKMGAGDGSIAQYQGPIYIDAIDWD